MKGLALFFSVTFSTLVFAADCPVDTPDFVAPAGTLTASNVTGWFGSEDLATMIPRDGHWVGMGPTNAYCDKFWWWRRGYDARGESDPHLKVFAEDLGKPGSRVFASGATNAFGDDWDAMLVMMEFPNSGCWRVTGQYQRQELQVVLEVGPE